MTEDTKFQAGGVNRAHSHSTLQKVTFAAGHFLIILICVWLVYGHGWEILGRVFGKDWHLADFSRAQILLACAFIYWVRHLITLFYLLERKVDWSEVTGVLAYIGIFETGLVLLGGGAFRNYAVQLSWWDFIAFVLYVMGSYLNSFAEIQRKWWKSNPANKGHCYTGGLFRYAVHINYFGDTVLFTGWCLFTHNLWVMAFPLVLAGTFIFFHIPGLDAYLTGRYGDEFKAYSKKTKKYIPFIY